MTNVIEINIPAPYTVYMLKKAFPMMIQYISCLEKNQAWRKKYEENYLRFRYWSR